MTIIRHDLVSAALVDPHLPRVGYTNLFRDGVVTVSSADADHPKELAYDGLTYDAWRTTGAATEWIRTQVAAQEADYMAIAAHTLAGCTLTPQHSPDGAAWTNIEAGYVAPDNRPIIWEFTAISKAYWRLLIENAAGAVSLGAIHVGLRTPMDAGLDRGWQPPELNEDVDYTNTISEGGQTLGRSIIRRGAKAQIASRAVDFTWAREEWLSFLEVAHSYAVFVWWAFKGKGEVLYGGVDKPRVQFANQTRVTTQFEVRGTSR